MLANHIGDLDVLREAIALAKRRMLDASSSSNSSNSNNRLKRIKGMELMAQRVSRPPPIMAEKKITFSEIGTDLYAFTAEGDPNSAVIVGDDGCLVFDAQATPAMANKVIERVRTVTDKPIKYVVLSHYHAVRVLGASAYKAQGDRRLAGNLSAGRRARPAGLGFRIRPLSRACSRTPQSIPGLTWPTLTFEGEMSIYLGKREVRLMQLGAGHTSGDIVAWVPDAEVMFSGDLIEYHSACYCGDAHLREWPMTLNEIRAFNPKAIAPGRGDALKGLATGARCDRDDARFRHHALWRGRNLGRQGPQPQGIDGGDARGDGSEIFELCDLRTLPAVQRLARVRRSVRDRRSRDLDRQARPGNVGRPARRRMTMNINTSPDVDQPQLRASHAGLHVRLRQQL